MGGEVHDTFLGQEEVRRLRGWSSGSPTPPNPPLRARSATAPHLPPKSSSPSWTCWCRNPDSEAPQQPHHPRADWRGGWGCTGHPVSVPWRFYAEKELRSQESFLSTPTCPQGSGCSPRRAPCRAGTCPGRAGPWSRRRPAGRISTKRRGSRADLTGTDLTDAAAAVKPTLILKPALGREPPEPEPGPCRSPSRRRPGPAPPGLSQEAPVRSRAALLLPASASAVQ